MLNHEFSGARIDLAGAQETGLKQRVVDPLSSHRAIANWKGIAPRIFHPLRQRLGCSVVFPTG